MTISNRKFGVEIECVGITETMAVEILRNAGINISDSTHYRHNGYDSWKAIHDGSLISNNGRSCEVVSPILSGTEGLEELKKVAKLLAAAGATVNKTCGMHVHMDAHDLTGDQIRNIVVRYARHEAVIDSFMPKSRRANNNSYCSSVDALLNNTIGSSYDVASRNNNRKRFYSQNVNEFLYPFINYSDRRYKINLTAYSRYKTIEFRQHSGSVNASKMEHWVKFLVQFVEQSITNVPENTIAPLFGQTRTITETITDAPEAPPVRNDSNYPTRVAYSTHTTYAHRCMLDSLVRNVNEYVSVESLARSARINPNSVPSYISALRSQYGMIIKNSRTNGYKYVRNTAVVTAPTTPAEPVTRTITREVPVEIVYPSSLVPVDTGDSVWAGVSPEIQSFYEERISDLSTST